MLEYAMWDYFRAVFLTVKDETKVREVQYGLACVPQEISVQFQGQFRHTA